MSSALRLRMLSSSLRTNSSIPRSRLLSRKLHQRRPLLYSMEDGLGNFLPPAALRTAVEWQEGLLQRLNEEVKGTAQENTTVTQTVIDTSTLKERTLAFNYASLALNNSFFLDQLCPPPSDGSATHERTISPDLLGAINQQHGSLRQLKSSISAAALGMFSNGWIWLVTDEKGVTGVLPTFGPGTLLVRSRTYMAAEKGAVLGDIDISASMTDLPLTSIPRPGGPEGSAPTSKPQPPGTGATSPTTGSSLPTGAPRPPSSLGPRFMHTTPSLAYDIKSASPVGLYDSVPQPASTATILNVGRTLYPLLCIPVYEHSWMSAGYGVWGKEAWLKEFWSVVDWSKVSRSYRTALSTNVKTAI
ncbi:Manganese/iron superoxide dismutase [Coprinopsis sp. MPI-PUGE-AT-0042]|nr:Manganese/iron superoxide dismutase [Coprinopsis sp. MPI-PUGE-AT-0042]